MSNFKGVRAALRLTIAVVLSVLVPFTASAQEVLYVHTDGLGSVVLLTDKNRNVVERNEYEPYGRLLNRPVTDRPGYAGHVMDATTDLTYMQQRYYDQGIGKFLSVDPVTAMSSVGSFNRYRYGNNNPYKFTDPDGRNAILLEAAVVLTVAATIFYFGTSVEQRNNLGKQLDTITKNAVNNVISQNSETNSPPADSSGSAGEKIKEGTRPAAGVSGQKGEREGDGGVEGAHGAFDNVNGTNEKSPRPDVRVKDLADGGRIETHPSTKSPDYPQGTQTVKVQDSNGRVTTTVRFPNKGQ